MDQVIAERLEELKAKLQSEADEQSAKVDAALTELKNESAAERTALQEEAARWRAFAEAHRQLNDATSQPEILSRFLRLGLPFAEGLAVYITKSDGLALWKSKGNGAFPEIISPQTTDPEFYFRTISVRGKTVGAIYATPPFKADGLDYLATSLEYAIEIFGLKLRTPGAARQAAS